MAKRTRAPQQVMMANLVRRVRPKLRIITRAKFESAKAWFLSAVESHHISEDIRSGNASPFLSSATGTLFGFLGFEAGSEPISDLLDVLDSTVRYQESLTKTKNSLYSVNISFPTRSELVAKGIKTPWDESRPWVSAIEEGISGLPYYLNKPWVGSRSGEGFQVKNGQVRSAEFTGTPYLTPLIAQFRKKLLLR